MYTKKQLFNKCLESSYFFNPVAKSQLFTQQIQRMTADLDLGFSLKVWTYTLTNYEKKREAKSSHWNWHEELGQTPRILFTSSSVKMIRIVEDTAEKKTPSAHPITTYVGLRITVRWSNFDRRDPKKGAFLPSTEATPCGHLLKWKLTPENPPADTMFMAAMTMVLPWTIGEDFQSFVKNTKLWPSL
jgi:hypothetical protein